MTRPFEAAKAAAKYPNFDTLPDGAWARQAQLIRDPKHPGVPTPLPFGPATLWRKVAAGQFPKPTKLGPRITAWKVGDIRAWIADQMMEAVQ